jgi:hypothetical protein
LAGIENKDGDAGVLEKITDLETIDVLAAGFAIWILKGEVSASACRFALKRTNFKVLLTGSRTLRPQNRSIWKSIWRRFTNE